MNLTLKDIPENLHARLRQEADETGRSINKLIIYTLEQTFSPTKVDRAAWLKKVQQEREAMSTWIDNDSILNAKNEARA